MSTLQNLFLSLLLSSSTFFCQYNYLCDFDSKFDSNSIQYGSWTRSGCQVSQGSQYAAGPVTWLNNDNNALQWTDYTIESTISIGQTSSSPWVGLIFRATAIGNSWDSGEYYYVALLPSSDKITNSEFNNGFTQGTMSGTVSIKTTSEYPYTSQYILRIVVSGNSWQIYLDGTLRHSGSDNSFPRGSVGLRTYDAKATFKTLYITFPSVSPTKSPTKSPIAVLPSKAPSKSPTTTTTSSPTASPTTIAPTTTAPTTTQPTTSVPTTATPTNMPSTSVPTTYTPTTNMPSTFEPTTSNPTTSEPTTNVPTTANPTTYMPTTSGPTLFPTTSYPTITQPTMSPITKSPTNRLNLPMGHPTPSPTHQREQGVDHEMKTSFSVTYDQQNHGSSKIIENVFVMEDWMFIVGGAIFAILCMTCAILIYYAGKRITQRKQKQHGNVGTDTYNMTAEMVKIASVSNFDSNQNHIMSVSTPNENGMDTCTSPNETLHIKKNVFNMDSMNHISSKSNDALMINPTMTPMGFDDFMNSTTDGNIMNMNEEITTTEMTLQNTDTFNEGTDDSAIVDTFNEGTDDMIIESSDDGMGVGVGVTMGVVTDDGHGHGHGHQQQYNQDEDEQEQDIILDQMQQTLGNDDNYVL